MASYADVVLGARQAFATGNPYIILSKPFLKIAFHLISRIHNQECTMRKNLPKTLDQLIFCKCLVNIVKFTKYLVNVPKFTKYLVNSYNQRGVKHYVLTN